MAVAVESPLILNISTATIPQGGTFIAGRVRRINNDPYGGEGFVWDDIFNLEEDVSAERAEESKDDEPEPPSATAADILPKEQSVATKRLDQLKQHLIELSRPKRAVEGFSLDNIHLGMGSLQDWQGPQWNCPTQRYMAPYPQFGQEWQSYARNILFGAAGQQPGMMHRYDIRRPVIAEPLEEGYCPIGAQYSRVLESVAGDMVFDAADVHCNPWSSLMAHRRREIAAIA